MNSRITGRKHLPLSGFHVLRGLREDSQGLRLYPITWEGNVTGEVQSQKTAHKADPIRARIFLNELCKSSVQHPLCDNLQGVHRNADEGNDVRVT